MSPRRVEPCYWCGSASTGRDHVFPLSLFEQPLPSDFPELPTVPACDDHNKHLQIDEEYFRALVVTPAYRTETGRRMWENQMLRQFQRAPAFRKLLASQIRTVDLYSRGGIFLGTIQALQSEPERVNRVLEKIVRGLYYDTHKEILGDVGLRFLPINPLVIAEIPPGLKPLIAAMPTPKRIGESVLYSFGSAVEDKRAAAWVLIFFQHSFFVVLAMPGQPGATLASMSDFSEGSG